MKRSSSIAFSLVELSIVLVILGLLIGGILTGQSLIRAAELRSITSQYQRYVTAAQTFRDKYFAIPGDMNNAQSFWGVAHATPATCITTVGTGTQTCNGDGNGRVDISAGSDEIMRFWQHLANAGLIEGQYSGAGYATGSTAANSPRGSRETLWFTYWWGNLSGQGDVFDGKYNNMMEVGKLVAAADPRSSAFRAEELWNMDTKIDDGKPATGKLVARSNLGLSAVTTTVSNNPATLNAEYLLTSTDLVGVPIFRDQY